MAEPWYRTAFGAFYPVLYAHRDEAEARRCLGLLPHLAPLADARNLPVLDLGCGDGRHLANLRERGIAAVGLDLSWALLQAAAGRGVPLVRADMRQLPFRDRTCGSVLSLFTAFAYFGPAGDEEVAASISRILAPGGHWFLDYLDADRVATELAAGPGSRTRYAGPLVVSETRRLEQGGGAVTKRVTLRPAPRYAAEAAALGVGTDGVEYEERVVLYSLAGLDAMAARQGLIRVAAAGGYDGEPLGTGARWLLAYRKESWT